MADMNSTRDIAIEMHAYDGENPFASFPVLKSIWPDPLSRLAEEGLVELLSQPANVEAGQVFILEAAGRPIGITGYFPYEIEAGPGPEFDRVVSAGLAWHGVIPEFRRLGISSMALPQVALMASMRFRNAKDLVELLPDSEYGNFQRPFFEKLGFKPAATHVFDWIDSPMTEYRVQIDAIKAERAKKKRFGIF